MLAQRLARPAARRSTASDSLAATMVHSAGGMRDARRWSRRSRPPFRAPHHTTSTIALVGGGSAALRPGEICLAHGGVLFLDELGEFSPAVARRRCASRWRKVSSGSRVRNARAVLPARFQLVAATNPCPCGGGAAGVVRVRRRRPAALHAPPVGSAARSLRPARRGAHARRRRSARRGERGEPTAVVASTRRRGTGPRARAGRAAQRRARTASCSTSPRSTPQRRRCCAPRWSAAGSPAGATTGCGGSPARSPTSPHAATTGVIARRGVDVGAVEVALGLRPTRVRRRSPTAGRRDRRTADTGYAAPRWPVST